MDDERTTRWVMIATTGLLVAGGVVWLLGGPEWASSVVWALAGIGPLVRLTGAIIGDVRRGRPGVDVIALLAVSGALILGEYLTAGIIGLMLATGQFLDGYAAGRAERELTALVARAPRIAHLISNGEVHTVDLDVVGVGDRLLVKSGEVVPVDGVVTDGPAVLDEAALTGEPMPVEHPVGDRVSSGVVNAARAFELRAVSTAADSTYAGIIRLVAEAQRSRAPAVRLADRWAAWFVPLTLLVAGLGWIVSGDPIRALAVLVVATPCPLLLAVPIAIVSGISRGARRGVIFRGGAAVEMLAQVTQLVVDKTGTLTVGEPRLRSIVGFGPDLDETEVLRLAGSVEQVSTHLLARAVVAETRRRGLDLTFPDDVVEVPGGGVSGVVAGRAVAVGHVAWLLAGRPEPAHVADYRRRSMREAPLSLFVVVDGDIVGAATFDDTIRSDAATTLRRLRREGVERVVMATGDHPVVAQSVGLAIGVDEVLAECTPEEKVDAIAELRQRGVTAMVGDGINDAPALAVADVGVAMGARGATASSESANVVLMVDRLQRLVDAIAIAKRSRRIALESVIIGMGMSLVAMVLAVIGLLPPIAGALVQEVIDVIAIGNALRALTGTIGSHRGPSLSPELSAQLRAEHDVLIPRIDGLRAAADGLDTSSPSGALATLAEMRRFLVDEVLPHEAEDDRVIYPEVASLLEGDDPLAAMSRTHREIFHLVELFRRLVDDLPDEGPGPGDLRDLRRILYGLHAVLRLHFAQEEELYASLDESYGATSVPTAL